MPRSVVRGFGGETHISQGSFDQKETVVRRIWQVALAFVVTLGGLVVAESPALAAGGGCNHFTPSGWSTDVCISARGNTVYPDFYINSKPSGTCTFKYYLEKPSGEQQVASGSCTLGHHGQYPVVVSSGPLLCYFSILDLTQGSTKISQRSPSWCY